MSIPNVCPFCNAPLQNLEEGSGISFCPYCGRRIVDPSVKTINVNINKTDKKIDEARIVESNNKREFDIKKLEIEAEKEKKNSIYGSITLILFVLLGFYSCYAPRYREQEEIKAGKIRVGTSSSEFEGMSYQAAEAMLKSAGFTDVQCFDLYDASFFLGNDGKVVSIAIGGDSYFYSSDYFFPDESVVITHH